MKRTVPLLFLLLVLAPSALGTVLLRMDLDDLTAESHAVVYGRIVASRVEWNESRTLIYTVYTVQPLEYLKGNLGPSFELHEPGGELDGLGMQIASVPVFSVGEEAVLFVWTDARGQHQVIGFEQGVLTVQTDLATALKMVNRRIRLGSARTAASAARPAAGTSRFLPQLFHQIRSSAARTRKTVATQ
ncbi:MAG: hypothetical protein O7A06_12195 [Acidobacteria bacterium]|nr:hypothetical protein [Acidobacteriota bacterium]MCZ6752704.1 hypothetical protein [Acidobacteriota bacterium]